MTLSFPSNLLIGTSSWSSSDWCGSFYPEQMDSGDMIRIYSSKMPTVEIDSTWYRIPSRKMVEAWKSKTPDGFVFSSKVPKAISHDKYLEDCDSELNEFISVMSLFGEKLGPMILQFPYVAKGKDPEEYKTGADFLRRLKGFVRLLPKEYKWGVEIRNSSWVQTPLLDLLRENDISLVFIDYYTMEPLPKLIHRAGIFTSSFVYIRFLGDRRYIEDAVKQARTAGQRNRDWESLLIDRSTQMKSWISPLRQIVVKGIPVYVYFNNHYAGYAPGSVELFSRLYREMHEDCKGADCPVPGVNPSVQ